MSDLLNIIVGGWSLTAAKLEISDGTTEDMFGSNPRGSIVSPHDRYFDNRRPLCRRQSRKALSNYDGYTGRFSLDGDKLEIDVDASWAPTWVGGKQVRYAKLDGDVLHVRTAQQTHPTLFPKADCWLADVATASVIERSL